MIVYLTLLCGVLILLLLAGLVRVLIGPSQNDQMLASQLFGTAGVAILILLSVIQDQETLLNAAMVLALLAPLSLITFIRSSGR